MIGRLLLLALSVATGAEASERVASLSPAGTRIARDLGAADALVAVTRWCELPEGHPARRDLDAFEPDVERLVAARPTLVILPRLANPLLADRLRGLGLRTEILSAESPESPALDIARLGLALGRRAEAERLLAERRACEKGPKGERRLLVIWDGVMAGEGSYLAWAIAAAGGRALPGAGRWPEWDAERVARYNPEMVLYLSDAAPGVAVRAEDRLREWRSLPALAATHAAREGCVFHLRPNSDWLPASGLPAAARMLRELAEKPGVR